MLLSVANTLYCNLLYKNIIACDFIKKLNSGILFDNLNIVKGCREHKLSPICTSITACKAKKNQKTSDTKLHFGTFCMFKNVLAHNQNNE